MKQQAPFDALAAVNEIRGRFENEVESLRGRIRDVQDRLDELDSSPVPQSEYIARINEWIDGKAAEFASDCEFKVAALRLPEARPTDVALGRIPVRGGQEAVAEVDVAGLLAFAVGDVLKARLREVVEAKALPVGLPSADRPELRRKLLGALDDLELAEERLIVQAETAGLNLPRRADCRPEIVLSPAL